MPVSSEIQHVGKMGTFDGKTTVYLLKEKNTLNIEPRKLLL